MKILVVCQYYAPEPFVLPDLCEELAARGHEVSVLCGVPNYPEGKAYDGYRHGKRRDEVVRGVQIHRTFTIARRHGRVFRLLNYLSYMVSSVHCAARMEETFDVVLAYQLSPVTMAAAAIKYAKKHGKRVLLYCLDVWPDSLAVGGVSEKSLLYRIFRRVAKDLYRVADRLLVTSPSMRARLEETMGLDPKRLGCLPQYAAMELMELPAAAKKTTRDLVFAGNVGLAQSVPTILHAAKLLETDETLHWHIVGDGSELAHCQALAKELDLTNVHFYGKRPPEEMPAFYAMADAMVLTLHRDALLSMMLPAKLQSYMAAGKAIVGAADGAAPSLIAAANCGYCAAAEDAAGLADCVRRVLQASTPFGENARAYYDVHFARDRFFDTLIGELEALRL